MTDILIVDDDDIIAELASLALKERGHSCRWAASGEEAMALLDESRPDLILLEQDLPDIAGLDWEGVFIKPGGTMETLLDDWAVLKPTTSFGELPILTTPDLGDIAHELAGEPPSYYPCTCTTLAPPYR